MATRRCTTLARSASAIACCPSVARSRTRSSRSSRRTRPWAQHPAARAVPDRHTVVELHHEQPDGRGYPHGLFGHATPLLARIVHVADAFDAMTSARLPSGPGRIARAVQLTRHRARNSISRWWMPSWPRGVPRRQRRGCRTGADHGQRRRRCRVSLSEARDKPMRLHRTLLVLVGWATIAASHPAAAREYAPSSTAKVGATQ